MVSSACHQTQLLEALSSKVSVGRWPNSSTFLYLGLGWLSVFIIYPIAQSIPLTGILLLALGGVTYSLGTILSYEKQQMDALIIWHLSY